MKLKRSKKLLILLSVLVLLALLCYGVTLIPNDSESDGENDGGEEYSVTSIASDDISSVTVKNTSGEFDFERKDGKWILATENAPELDSELIESMAQTISSAVGHNMLEGISDDRLADYGLDADSVDMTVVIGTTDGEIVCSFGDYNSIAGEYYFLSSEQSGIVFTVESSAREAFVFDMEDIIVKEELPEIESESITSVSVGDITYTQIKTKNEDYGADSDSDEETPEYLYSATVKSGDETIDVSYADYEAIASGVSQAELEYEAFTDVDNTEYGFESPYLMTICYTEKKEITADGASGGYIEEAKAYSLYIGVEDGVVYAKTSLDSRVVYTLDADFVIEYFVR